MTIKCAFCGKEFTTSDAKRKYCSPECYHNNHKTYVKGWHKRNKDKQAVYMANWLAKNKEQYKLWRRKYMREYMRKRYARLKQEQGTITQ